jgi:hypothetical protein
MTAMTTNGAAKAAIAVTIVVAGLAVSGGAIAAAGSSRSAALQSSSVAAMVAGRSAVSETAIYADDRPDVFARAASMRDALGFAKGATRKGRHVTDGLQNSTYDEVAEVDAAGQPTSLAQFDGSGRLLAAVRFDTPSRIGAGISGDQALKTAQRGLASAGLAPSGRASSQVNEAAGGWDVHWDRAQGGLRVRGDEVSVHVWQDGRIQSVAQVEHELAAAPARTIAQDQARSVVTTRCGSWFQGNDSGFSVQSMALEWVGPNAAFDAAKGDSATEPYRLAWVANVKPSGRAADSLRLVTLYVDAADGSIIGGDVVE